MRSQLIPSEMPWNPHLKGNCRLGAHLVSRLARKKHRSRSEPKSDIQWIGLAHDFGKPSWILPRNFRLIYIQPYSYHIPSMDWFKGKFTGTPHISWENPWFPVKFPLNQSIETCLSLGFTTWPKVCGDRVSTCCYSICYRDDHIALGQWKEIIQITRVTKKIANPGTRMS